MIRFIKKIFNPSYDHLIDGMLAHEYQTEGIRKKIREEYSNRFPDPSLIKPTPETHPWMFDPFDPPAGWAYDPYYEFWIKKD